MKEFSKSNKLKEFISPKKTYLTKFLDNNEKFDIYKGGNIHWIYSFLELIGASNDLAYSVKFSCNFGTSSSTNNDTASIQPVIAALRVRHTAIFECCVIIGHKVDACIIF